MIQLPPKKRVPELKLKKLDVTDPNPKRTLAPSLPSVTTVIDGIPIVEYLYDLGPAEIESLGRQERSPVIYIDSGESVPNSPNIKREPPQTGTYHNSPIPSKHFSPEPIRSLSSDCKFFENDIRTDSFVAMKKPTRWDSGPRRTYQLDIRNRTNSIGTGTGTGTEQERREFTADPNFKLQPRDPRVKTFKKHHRQKCDSRDHLGSVTFDENLMDISSPEYNPPSPFGSPPESPKVAFESNNKSKVTGFFDSDSDCSEMELSRKSSFYEMLTNSVERIPEYRGTIQQQSNEQKMCFWDTSSEEESVNPTRQDLQDIKLNSSSEDPKQKCKKFTIPRRSRGNHSSEEELETKYTKLEPKEKTTRSRSTSSIKESRECHGSLKEYRRSPRVSRRERGTKPEDRSSPIGYARDIPHSPRRIHVCIYCGDRGHASNDTCPLRVCSLCFKIGHNFRECNARGKNRPPKCMRCRISCHEKNRCGEIWRQCHNTTFLPNNYPQSAKKNTYNVTMEIQAFRIDQLKSNLYCCNCAKFGHVFFQCEKPHPSRYFHIPLVGHHDIPLSVAFKEIRDNADTRRSLTDLLPKPYQVVAQNFWGDGNYNDSSDSEHSTVESSRSGNWKHSYSKKRNSASPKRRAKDRNTTQHSKPPHHSSDTERNRDNKSPNRPHKPLTATHDVTAVPTLMDTDLQDYYKVAFKAYQLAFERANRGNALYARDLLNNRGFITVAPYPVTLEDRRQLTPLVYIPEGASVPQGVRPLLTPKEEETYTAKEPDIKSPIKRETSTLHESHANLPQTHRKGKVFPNKHRNMRHDKSLYKLRPPRTQKGRGDRDKRKFDPKSKRLQKHFADARECINRNRTMRETERQVRISHRSKSPNSPTPLEGGRTSRAKRSPIEERSPKRVVVKKARSVSSDNTEERELNIERLGLKLESINGDPISETETYMFIEEAN